MARYIIVSCTVCLILTAGSYSFAAFTEVFATSNECAFCHVSGPNALIDSEGNDLSIADDWSSTMMANSFKDPLFRAKVESEVSRTPQLAAAIEDKCLTCHTPMARTQALRDGAQSYSLAMAETSEFAWDGVSCTLCHQIQNDGLGTETSFSGNYPVSDQRKIFGPYKQVFVNPMINHVNYLPTYGEQVDKPELCATCHTLFTPYVDEKGEIAGEFPEQTPYLEWLNSTYASAENYRSCQDCHMPRIDEPIKITNRPPWYQVRQSPFWKHHFIGGNRFILEMMKDNSERLGIGVPQELFERTIDRTEQRLSQEAAEIIIERVEERDNRLEVDVHVVNKTGHKFPTGFPSRRAWLYLAVADAQGRLLFESGNYSAQGDIVGQQRPFEPHRTIIDSPDQTLIYQAVMGDVSGKQTDTLLKAATYLKDNRLPPRGYRHSGQMASYTSITGKAAADENFN
ncbi:MAG: multiheme c-type cytochrome, partial [Desulfocapsaceae bacterium]